jgi:hypothetical protein
MVIYKQKEYYTNSEMFEFFGTYDYNQYTQKFRRILLPIFEKESVDKFLSDRERRLEELKSIDLDSITIPKHRGIVEDRLAGNYTLQALATKYSMSKQNVSLILNKYKKKN